MMCTLNFFFFNLFKTLQQAFLRQNSPVFPFCLGDLVSNWLAQFNHGNFAYITSDYMTGPWTLDTGQYVYY